MPYLSPCCGYRLLRARPKARCEGAHGQAGDQGAALWSQCPWQTLLGKIQHCLWCRKAALSCWGWLDAGLVFSLPCAGWVEPFFPENAVLALLGGDMVAALLLLPGFGFCLPPEGGINPKEGGELSWLSFGMSKGEFASQRKGVPLEYPKAVGV